MEVSEVAKVGVVPEVLRANKVGFVELSKGRQGEIWGGLAVPDLDGQGFVCLPVRVDDGNEEVVTSKLKAMGLDSPRERWVMMEPSEDDREYLGKALRVMPPLLAFHATFGMGREINLEELLEDGKGVTPVIGLEAEPHSGKTMAMIVMLLTNPERLHGWDLDPFSGQSINQCMDRVVGRVVKEEIDVRKDLRRLMEVIEEVYFEEKPQKTEQWSLKKMLDEVVWDYLENARGKCRAGLVDLPGEDDNMWLVSAAHLLRHCLPTIDMTREVPEGKENVRQVPLSKAFGEDYANTAGLLVGVDRIRAELGGEGRYHRPETGTRAIERAGRENEEWRKEVERNPAPY